MNINKKIKLLDFKLTRALGGGLFGVYKSAFSGSGMEFYEHREYSLGDPVKSIDWKVSARSEGMYIKKYEEERDINVLFLIDNSDSMKFGTEDKTKTDILEEIFYSLSFSAIQNNDNVGAYIYNEDGYNFVPSNKSKGNIFRILEKINNVETHCNMSLQYKEKNSSKTENILEIVEKQNTKNNLIFILTDDTNFENEKLLRGVSNNNEIILINIFDYFENNLISKPINTTFNFAKNFLNINLGNDKKILEFKELRNKNILDLKLKLRKNKIGYLMLDSKKDLYKELIMYFSKISN